MRTQTEQIIPVARPYLRREEEAAVAEVLRSGWLSQGPRVAEFERAFADYVGAEHPVVEDAACAIGSEYHGRRVGAPHSVMACFSFHPRKILTTGEGGMITTANADLAARLRGLRQHAMSLSDAARHTARQVVFERYD